MTPRIAAGFFQQGSGIPVTAAAGAAGVLSPLAGSQTLTQQLAAGDGGSPDGSSAALAVGSSSGRPNASALRRERSCSMEDDS
jgi:hypothetical protein